MLLILVVIAVAISVLSDLIPISRSKKWWAFWVYSVMMFFALVLAICISFDVKLPSPGVALKKAITMVFGIE